MPGPAITTGAFVTEGLVANRAHMAASSLNSARPAGYMSVFPPFCTKLMILIHWWEPIVRSKGLSVSLTITVVNVPSLANTLVKDRVRTVRVVMRVFISDGIQGENHL